MIVAAVAVLAIAGCKKRGSDAPSPEVTGLAAVPASAEVLIGVDVAKLAESPIVDRAVEQLLMRDPELAQRWRDLQAACKLDIKQLKRVMLARGPAAQGARPGTGPALMVATGQIVEADFVKCTREVVGKGGGSLTVKSVDGHSLYQVKDGNRTLFLAFGRADTVLLGTSDTYTAQALGTGTKASDNPELGAWLKLVDPNQPVWAVGRVPEVFRAGLVRVSQDQLKAGPLAFVASADLTSGALLKLGAVMASEADAKALESIAKTQLVPLAWAAQLKSLGPVVNKVAISTDGTTVRFEAPLNMGDVNQVLAVLDVKQQPAQDSQPPAGAGSSTTPNPQP